jgi:deoxyadenosine/deoxycytidine kinase
MAALNQSKIDMPIIYIEGGIGCGKSTLVKKIQEHCEKNKLRILTIQEPVDIWMTIKDENTGKNMIEAFYEDQERYSFEFQMMAYISRLQRLHETIINAKDCDIIICERSLETDKNVFCKMLYDEGKISSYGYQIYNKWFNYFKLFDEQSKYVYLKTDYKICFERVNKRNRNGENEIPESYLEANNHYHDNWLLNENSDKTLILDGNQDADKNPSIFFQHIEKIFEKFVN